MMSSNESNGGGWLMDYGLVDEFPASDYVWSPQLINDPAAPSAILGLDVDVLQNKDEYIDKAPSKKRARNDAPGTKACREKMRRDRLNERFKELCCILDPGKPPRADKVAILRDAACLLKQRRLEAKKLKESNETLQDAIKNLKAEKLELRDEKTRLRSEKERMEQVLKGTSIAPPFISQPAPAVAMHSTSVANCDKTIAHQNFLPICMWQWAPPAALDTSQDHVLRPPVA